MADMRKETEKTSALRKKAEERLKTEKLTPEAMSGAEVNKLIYELKVHQTELQIQNEELRNTQTELEALNRKYSNLYDFAPVGYLTLNEDGLILEANLTAIGQLEVDKGHLLNTRFEGYAVKEDGDIFYLHRRQIFDTRMPHTCEIRLERRWSGAVFHALLDSIYVEDSNGNGVCRTSITDITERKKMEEAGMRMERLNTLGRITAGVVYELNNSLMGILNYNQYLQTLIPENVQEYSVLQDIEKESNRCIRIVENLRAVSRIEKNGGVFQKENLRPVIDSAYKLLSYRIKDDGISFDMHISGDTPEIYMKADSIQQLFVNLIQNAIDSLRQSREKNIHLIIHPEGEMVSITVADSGCGISRENMASVFEPFFTTKPVGEGTGLGLAICQSIVRAHGGEISCESEVGSGTRFCILLPVSQNICPPEAD